MKLVSLFCGYGSGTLSGGLITITDSVSTMKLYVPAVGIQILPLEWVAAPGKAITVTLAAGGSGVSGSINAIVTID